MFNISQFSNQSSENKKLRKGRNLVKSKYGTRNSSHLWSILRWDDPNLSQVKWTRPRSTWVNLDLSQVESVQSMFDRHNSYVYLIYLIW